MLILISACWRHRDGFVDALRRADAAALFGETTRLLRHVRRWIPRLTPFDKTRPA
jgi:hypothetical protein